MPRAALDASAAQDRWSSWAPSPGTGSKIFPEPPPTRFGSLWTVATSGGVPELVYKDSNHFIYDPAWSADGRHILFFADFSNGDIGVIPAQGGELTMLGVTMTMKYFLAVNPNGKQIVFADERHNAYLWKLSNLFGQAK